MKYVFVSPSFLVTLYFCQYKGIGFKLTTRLDDALVSADLDSAIQNASLLQQQSGFPVQVIRIM